MVCVLSSTFFDSTLNNADTLLLFTAFVANLTKIKVSNFTTDLPLCLAGNAISYAHLLHKGLVDYFVQSDCIQL